MPMTPQGRVPAAKSGEYVETLTCRGVPRCVRNMKERAAAQAEDCDMCERTYEYVDGGTSGQS